MKIKEAIKIINSTKTARASLGKEEIYFYADGLDRSDYFLMMPQKVNNWDDVDEDFEALYSIAPKDLARVMDVIQRLLDTPIKERFPEKKYCLRWIGEKVDKIFLGIYGKAKGSSNTFWATFPEPCSDAIFTESELEQLKKDNPRLAPAIDAMKEEVKDDDND